MANRVDVGPNTPPLTKSPSYGDFVRYWHIRFYSQNIIGICKIVRNNYCIGPSFAIRVQRYA